MRNQQFLPCVGVGKAAAHLSSFLQRGPNNTLLKSYGRQQQKMRGPTNASECAGGPGEAERHPARATQRDTGA